MMKMLTLTNVLTLTVHYKSLRMRSYRYVIVMSLLENPLVSIYFMMKWCIEPICEHL